MLYKYIYWGNFQKIPVYYLVKSRSIPTRNSYSFICILIDIFFIKKHFIQNLFSQ